MKIIPVDHLFPYIGGKKVLRPYIVPMIPGDISTYVEPFFGGGAIYFAREKWAPCEIINDINDEIINLYRIVKERGEEFAREFNFVFSSRTFFNRMKEPPLENHQYFQAFKTLYLLNFCFGARIAKPSYAPGNLSSVESIQARIIAISKRLQKTNIECLDYSVLLERYNKPDTFFYLDPPYFETEHYYKAGNFDHERLAELLKRSKARWILSYNACPEICGLYDGFNQRKINRRCSLNNKSAHDFEELLVWNFDEKTSGTQLDLF